MASEKPDMDDVPLDERNDDNLDMDDHSIRSEGHKGSNHGSFRQRMKDPEYINKLWHTVWLAGAFFASGMTAGQEGPCLLDLQIITGTDLEESSAFFTGRAIGYLVGAMLCGAVFERVNSNVLLFMATFGLGLMAIATPYCNIYAAMIVIRIVVGISGGIVDTAGSTAHIRLWGNEGEVLLQMLQFCFALGGVLSPIFSEPFLAKKSNETQLENELPFNTSSEDASQNLTRGLQDDNFTMIKALESLPESTDVLYAYIITAVVSFVTAIPFIVLLLKDVVVRTTERRDKADEKVKQRKLPKPLFLFILAAMGSFYMLYLCVEKTFASFLMTFLVDEYDFITKSNGAYMTAVLWASFAVSRFLMIFVSKLLSAVRMLYTCCILMTVAYTCFFISATFGAINAMAVFTAMAGLGMSGVFAAGFSWTESELLKVTGRVSSCILVLGSVGNMINPLVLGYLMEKVSNMWFCYQVLGLTLMMCAIFVFLLLFNRLYVNKHYGLISSVVSEISVVVHAQESEEPLNVHTIEQDGVKLTEL